MDEGTRRYIHTFQLAKDGETAMGFEDDIAAFKVWAEERGYTVVDCQTNLAREREEVETIDWGSGHFRNLKADERIGEPMRAGSGL